MLPPPITRLICVPARTASFTSAAMRSTVSISIPKGWPPIRASPEIFNRTRAYFGGLSTIPSPLGRSAPGHLLHFIGEIACRTLVDAFAHGKAEKAHDLDRRAEILGGLLDHLSHRRLAVDDERLRQQHGLLVEFAHPAFHHLLDDVFRLA